MKQPYDHDVADAGAAVAETAVPIDGAQLLDDVRAYVRRFVVFQRQAYYDLAPVWAAGTWVHQVFSTYPRLAFLGPKASGKTRAMEIELLLCSNPHMELDPTGPVLAKMIAQEHPTIGIDETDTIWGKGGSNTAKTQLRAILNSGYKAGASLTRLKGGEYISTPVYGPVVFAGIGNLPETLTSRSLCYRTEPRRPEQAVEAYFPRVHAPIGTMLGKSLGEWAGSQSGLLADAWPDLPDGVEDRAAECAEPLCAIADAAGGHWPATVRAALREVFLDVTAQATPSPAMRVLADLRMVWPADAASMSSHALTDALRALPESPWATLWPPEGGPRELAALLSSHGIAPVKVKISGRPLQGYRRTDLQPAWDAMPAPAPQAPAFTDEEQAA